VPQTAAAAPASVDTTASVGTPVAAGERKR
jgi:hypothetical protein